MTTLDNPLHKAPNPSTREIVTMAFDMPVYMAPGDGLMIWIRVCTCVRVIFAIDAGDPLGCRLP